MCLRVKLQEKSNKKVNPFSYYITLLYVIIYLILYKLYNYRIRYEYLWYLQWTFTSDRLDQKLRYLSEIFPLTCQKFLLVPNEIANVQPTKCLPFPEDEEVTASFMCGSQPAVRNKNGRSRGRPRKTHVAGRTEVNQYILTV